MKLAAVALTALIVLTSCHVPGHSDLEDAGTPPERRVQKDDGCPPPVAWVLPGHGRVTERRVCPGWFGTEIVYIKVAGKWIDDPGRTCRVSDDWGPTTC